MGSHKHCVVQGRNVLGYGFSLGLQHLVLGVFREDVVAPY